MNHFQQLYPHLNNSRIDQYYDCNEFNHTFIGDVVNDFSIWHVNIRSLNANGGSLVVYLSSFNREFDVACLTETRLVEPGLRLLVETPRGAVRRFPRSGFNSA